MMKSRLIRHWPGRAAVLLATATTAAALLAGMGTEPASASVHAAAAARIRWDRVEPVPGLAALNKGYNAAVNALSCWAQSYCAAAGFYTDKHHHSQAWVALELKGRWAGAVQVPGTAALNGGGSAQVGYVSCAMFGCVAVGTYTTSRKNTRWFTASERAGRWGKAAPVPIPALHDAGINTVWCAPGGLCAAGGGFTDPSGAGQAWVMTETSGRWHGAEEVPGNATLNIPGGGAATDAVSCSSPGNCAAGGTYTFSSTSSEGFGSATSAFVVSEADGVWGTAEEVPGVSGMNSGDDAWTSLIACPSASDCTAAGYAIANQNTCSYPCQQTFAVSEDDGVWGAAVDTGLGDNSALACVSAGNCALGGGQRGLVRGDRE
jgi:hypothetical protein